MPCPSGGWTPGDQRITLTHDGIERVYEVHVPPGYTGTTRVPLVMTIHGAHNTIAMVKGWSQMNPVADANGFIVVYPQAVDCWNSGSILPGCTAADDDVGFLTTVVADIESHACIDPKRVYATGISNGAMMAQKLGCDEADVFAAVGGIAGPGGNCNPSRPISVVYMHGTEDGTVGFSGAERTFTGWGTRNGCTGSPVETYNHGLHRVSTRTSSATPASRSCSAPSPGWATVGRKTRVVARAVDPISRSPTSKQAHSCGSSSSGIRFRNQQECLMRTTGTWISIVMGLLALPSYAAAQDLPRMPPSGYYNAVAANPKGTVDNITYGSSYVAQGLYTAGLLNKPEISRYVLDAWIGREREKLARQ